MGWRRSQGYGYRSGCVLRVWEIHTLAALPVTMHQPVRAFGWFSGRCGGGVLVWLFLWVIGCVASAIECRNVKPQFGCSGSRPL